MRCGLLLKKKARSFFFSRTSKEQAATSKMEGLRKCFAAGPGNWSKGVLIRAALAGPFGYRNRSQSRSKKFLSSTSSWTSSLGVSLVKAGVWMTNCTELALFYLTQRKPACSLPRFFPEKRTAPNKKRIPRSFVQLLLAVRQLLHLGGNGRALGGNLVEPV